MKIQNKAKPLKAMSKEPGRYAFHTAQLAVRENQVILETSTGRILARTVVEAGEEELDRFRAVAPVCLPYAAVQEWQKGGDLTLGSDATVVIRKGPGEVRFPLVDDVRWPVTDELFEDADKHRAVTLTLNAEYLYDLAAAIGKNGDGLLPVTIYLGKPTPKGKDGDEELPAHNTGAYRVEVVCIGGKGLIMPISIV